MANTSNLVSVSLSADGDGNDVATRVYRVQYDDVPTNEYTALAMAQAASGQPVPARRARLLDSQGLYAMSIDGAAVEQSRKVWHWTVKFSRPQGDEGIDGPGFEEQDPLLRPPVFNISYIEREYVIAKARNVEALPHGDGKGGERAANTPGSIVNAAGKRPDEPQMDTERTEVLIINKNFASLAAIVTLNREFKRTTNSSSVQGYSARQLKYLLCESLGENRSGDYTYWPGVIMIEAADTTDLTLDNVGTVYWDEGVNKFKEFKDADGNGMADLSNLTINGGPGGDFTSTITWRHLTEKDYAPLFK